MADSCTVDNCANTATAKGMCGKHRMRVLRTGDPQTTRHPGRHADPLRAINRQIFSDQSDRSFARFWAGREAFNAAGVDTVNAAGTDFRDDLKHLVERPNGSMNMTAWERAGLRALVAEIIAQRGPSPTS